MVCFFNNSLRKYCLRIRIQEEKREQWLWKKPRKKKVRIRIAQRVWRLHVDSSTAAVPSKRQAGDFLALHAITDLQVTWRRRWQRNGQKEKLEKHCEWRSGLQPREDSSCLADAPQHSGLRHKFLATLSIHKESNMYWSSSEDCGLANGLRLQVTLKFHCSLHKTHLLKMRVNII